MIKFFRKIRQKLLFQNRFSKYLIYAIGEIILVVIGILIALWINNWNQEQIISKKTDYLLSHMVSDLKTDIARFDRDIGRMEEAITKAQFILRTKDFEFMPADSLYSRIPRTLIFYRITNQSFERFKNSGITHIEDAEELFSNITEYYTFQSTFYETVISWDTQGTLEMTNFFVLNDRFEAPGYRQEFIAYSEDEIFRKKALVSLLSTIKSRNYIRHAISRKGNVLAVLKSTRTTAKKLLSSIEDRLNKK